VQLRQVRGSRHRREQKVQLARQARHPVASQVASFARSGIPGERTGGGELSPMPRPCSRPWGRTCAAGTRRHRTPSIHDDPSRRFRIDSPVPSPQRRSAPKGDGASPLLHPSRVGGPGRRARLPSSHMDSRVSPMAPEGRPHRSQACLYEPGHQSPWPAVSPSSAPSCPADGRATYPSPVRRSRARMSPAPTITSPPGPQGSVMCTKRSAYSAQRSRPRAGP